MQIIFLAFLVFSTYGISKTLKSHEHGKVTLSLALKKSGADIRLEGPGESFFGFEHEARTPKDKKIQEENLGKLKNKILTYIKFDEKLKCTLGKADVDIEREDDHHDDDDHKKNQHKHEAVHSEVEGSYTVNCQKNPQGSEVRINFAGAFTHIDDVIVQVLSDSGQSSKTLKKGVGSVKL